VLGNEGRALRIILAVAAALAVTSSPALAQPSENMSCSHFRTMNAADQMAVIDSMHSGIAAANEMSSGGNRAADAVLPSDHMSTRVMTRKVATTCRAHPDTMVEDAMHNVMPH
jgi:hypothetical protein